MLLQPDDVWASLAALALPLQVQVTGDLENLMSALRHQRSSPSQHPPLSELLHKEPL